METAIVSGRVEVGVKERAGAYIKAAGLTPADVIKRVWEHIAQTGDIPDEVVASGAESKDMAWDSFMSFRRELNARLSADDLDFYANLDKEGLRAMRVADLEVDNEAL